MQEIDYGQDDLTTIRPSMICNRRDDTTIIRAGELWYGPNATIESVQYFLANLQNIVTNNQNDSSILPALLEHTKNLLTAMQKTASILQGEVISEKLLVSFQEILVSMCRYISDIPNIGYKDNENESSWVNNLLYIGGGIAGGIIGGACLVWLGIRCYKPVVKNIDVSVPGVSNKVTMVSCAQIEKDGETKYIELNDPQSCVLNESGEICYKIYKDNQAILAPKVNLIKIESHGITNYLPKEEYDKKFFKNKGCTMVSEAEKKAYDYYIKNKPKPFESSANIDDNIHLSGTMPQVNEE